MKAISLGLISSIIFNIVLAQKCLGSESFMNCFSFLKKKSKKKHKIDEPVKVKGAYDPDIPDLKFIDEFDPTILEDHEWHQTELDEPFTSETNGTIVDKAPGFLKGENEPKKKGWYIRPYEEEYEDMINAKFMSLKNNYQSNQKDADKQEYTTIAIPNSPEKQELSTINEEYLSAECEGEEFGGEAGMFRFMIPECGVIIQGVWADDLGLKLQGLCDEAHVELSIT
ncbi:erythrocyte membrane antigen 1 [Plasmodium vinckei brucechwatti]|uniref:Erythrocyte membrane antigen 1 n=1 Tax=Plasmodium vinckei brucechwatti TaxID=119398 RepID=A0A6V7S1C0_PLAVN|nr:erythrocyte membrane antigen 1 [Plasmodium vinckei brucechwatti]